MDNEYIDAAFERIDAIGQSGFVIYLALCKAMDENGQVQTTQRDIADLCKMGIATVNRTMPILKVAGLITFRKHVRDVTTYQVIKMITYQNDKAYTTITTNNKESLIKSSIDCIKMISHQNDKLSNGRFDLADAQALIGTLTGWVRIPGNPDQATHALGAVIDLHDRYKDETLEYLRPYWQTFKERYPRSTHIFWLTDWAVQGTIPQTLDERKKSRVKQEVFEEH